MLQALDALHSQGIAALLDYARRHNITSDHVPLDALTNAELDAKMGLQALLPENLR